MKNEEKMNINVIGKNWIIFYCFCYFFVWYFGKKEIFRYKEFVWGFFFNYMIYVKKNSMFKNWKFLC